VQEIILAPLTVEDLAQLIATLFTANRRVRKLENGLLRWHKWFTQRRVGIHFLLSSLFPSWPRKICSPSIVPKGDGPGT
jgi:hypothetical protein